MHFFLGALRVNFLDFVEKKGFELNVNHLPGYDLHKYQSLFGLCKKQHVYIVVCSKFYWSFIAEHMAQLVEH